STANTAIGVGAMVGNYAHPGEVMAGLRQYSGRGPRIDGELGIDIVAPSDDFAAVPHILGSPAAFGIFDGTSGALPQVAGTVAVMLGAQPSLTAAEITSQLAASAAI